MADMDMYVHDETMTPMTCQKWKDEGYDKTKRYYIIPKEKDAPKVIYFKI
jgi:hypothetical protein